jgi:dolichyl-phosphate-mannose--protein O-mannosyl transferase
MPNPADILGIIRFFPTYTKWMYKINSQPHFFSYGHPAQSRPPEWLIGKKGILFSKTGSVTLASNVFTWILVPISFIALLVGYDLSRFKKSIMMPQHIDVLCLAYLANFLPFFFISRMLFIYHYFSALIIGYLVIPLTVLYIAQVFNYDLTDTRKKNIVVFATIGVVFVFIILIPFTYGV